MSVGDIIIVEVIVIIFSPTGKQPGKHTNIKYYYYYYYYYFNGSISAGLKNKEKD